MSDTNTSMQYIIDVLKDKSETSLNGKMGKEAYIDKTILKLAATYLEDYLYYLEN